MVPRAECMWEHWVPNPVSHGPLSTGGSDSLSTELRVATEYNRVSPQNRWTHIKKEGRGNDLNRREGKIQGVERGGGELWFLLVA